MRGRAYPGGGPGTEKGRERVLEGKEMEMRLAEGRMGEREVDEAIRVTEERLEALKGVVGRRKAGRADGKGG